MDRWRARGQGRAPQALELEEIAMVRRSLLVSWTLAAALLPLGCSKQPDETPANRPAVEAAAAPSATPAPAAAPTAASAPAAAPSSPAAATGSVSTLTGKITLTGTVPPRKPIKMNADANCSKQHTTAVLSEDIIADPKGMLQNVFVYVKTGLEGRTFAPPATAAVLDQKGCMYVPHVSGVMVNQKIQILNSDPTLHNVHALPKVGEFNVGMPRQNMAIERKFTQPEVMVHFKCDVHPWMSAWVGVLPHPFFAVSDAAGNYSIPDLPPGTYTIEAWHEKLGTQSQTLKVVAGQAPKLDFSFKAPTS
jgi:hypothetical protein